MQNLKPAFWPVNICCACNEKYADPLSVCLYSLLKNADKSRVYDIVILHSAISAEAMGPFEKLEEHFDCCKIRFVDMMAFREGVKHSERTYITAETNYRLAVFGELFANYDRILYLDCDTIVEGDISELFDMDLKGCAIGGAPATDVMHLRLIKKGFFIDGEPHNLTYYEKSALGLREPDRYFNAGVLVIDLKKARGFVSEEQAVELLNSRDWFYYDQDVLNMLFMDRVYLLDVKWNYTVNIETSQKHPNPQVAALMEEAHRTEYGIIHYISGNKPWIKEDVALGEHYHRYEKEFTEVILCHEAGKAD